MYFINLAENQVPQNPDSAAPLLPVPPKTHGKRKFPENEEPHPLVGQCKRAQMLPIYNGIQPTHTAGPDPYTPIIQPYQGRVIDMSWVCVKWSSFWTGRPSPLLSAQLRKKTKLWVAEKVHEDRERINSVNGPANLVMRPVTIYMLELMKNLTTVVLHRTSHVQYKWLLMHATKLTSFTLSDSKEFCPVTWYLNLKLVVDHWKDKGGIPLTILRMVNLTGLSAHGLADMAKHFPRLRVFEIPSKTTQYLPHQIWWLMKEIKAVTQLELFDCVAYSPIGALLWPQVKHNEKPLHRANFCWRREFVRNVILPQMMEEADVKVGTWLYTNFVEPQDSIEDVRVRYFPPDCFPLTLGQMHDTMAHAPQAPVYCIRPSGYEG